VPFDRFKKYIKEVKMLDLIEDENTLRLTAKGKQFLDEYKSILEFLRRMGLKYK